jgi:hypothetical protein
MSPFPRPVRAPVALRVKPWSVKVSGGFALRCTLAARARGAIITTMLHIKMARTIRFIIPSVLAVPFSAPTPSETGGSRGFAGPSKGGARGHMAEEPNLCRTPCSARCNPLGEERTIWAL